MMIAQPVYPATGPYTVTPANLQAHSDGINDLYSLTLLPELQINDAAVTQVISASNTWTQVPIRLANATVEYSANSGLLQVANGIQVLQAGRYEVLGETNWPGHTVSANGRRITSVGINASGNANYSDVRQELPVFNAQVITQPFPMISRQAFTLAANDIIGLWVYSTQASLTVTGARLMVRRVA